MAFAIYNIHQCHHQPEKDSVSMSKGDWITLFTDGALITGAALIVGLILSGVINTGIPMGVGTLGNGLLGGGCAVIGGLFILDFLIVFFRKTTPADWGNMALVHHELGWSSTRN